MTGSIDFLVAQRELEVRSDIGIDILVQIHRDRVFGPDEREEVEIALDGIRSRRELAVVGVRAVIKRLSPMASAVEIAVLDTVFDAIVMAHFADIYLAAFRPNDAAFVSQLRCLLVD